MHAKRLWDLQSAVLTRAGNIVVWDDFGGQKLDLGDLATTGVTYSSRHVTSGMHPCLIAAQVHRIACRLCASKPGWAEVENNSCIILPAHPRVLLLAPACFSCTMRPAEEKSKDRSNLKTGFCGRSMHFSAPLSTSVYDQQQNTVV